MFSFLPLTLFVSLALGAPSGKGSGCDVSNVMLELPSGQTQLMTPTTSTPAFIALGVGVQNYTCSATGTYTSVHIHQSYTNYNYTHQTRRNVGALAELFDISCVNPSFFDSVTEIVSSVWQTAPADISAVELIHLIGTPSVVLGQHYFIVNPITGVGLSPKWDFTSASQIGHPDAYVVGARVGDILSPADPTTDIDWLALTAAQGDLADQIFRVQTRGGQPPTSVSLLMMRDPITMSNLNEQI